jgi:hypothetical protein
MGTILKRSTTDIICDYGVGTECKRKELSRRKSLQEFCLENDVSMPEGKEVFPV